MPASANSAAVQCTIHAVSQHEYIWFNRTAVLLKTVSSPHPSEAASSPHTKPVPSTDPFSLPTPCTVALPASFSCLVRVPVAAGCIIFPCKDSLMLAIAAGTLIRLSVRTQSSPFYLCSSKSSAVQSCSDCALCCSLYVQVGVEQS